MANDINDNTNKPAWNSGTTHKLKMPNGRTLNSYQLLPLLGLRPNTPIPKDLVMDPVNINGTEVRVVAGSPEGRKTRVWALCDQCGRWIPAGRIEQHQKARHLK